MTPHLATLQYNEMLRLLSRRGIRKAPGQTPLEFAGSVLTGTSRTRARIDRDVPRGAVRRAGFGPAAATSLLTEIQTRIQSAPPQAVRQTDGGKLHAMLE